MNYDNSKPIFQQIADKFCEQILQKSLKANDRIPSVRELAVSMEVNPNTIMRTYQYLQDKNIVYNKRGIGFFVNDNAYQTVLKIKKEEFLNKDLPLFIKKAKLLNLDLNEIINNYKNSNNNENK